jgi:CRP/FNR family transcriptional regulator
MSSCNDQETFTRSPAPVIARIRPREGVFADPLFAEIAASAVEIRLRKGAILYRAGDARNALYQVGHGGIRHVMALANGGSSIIAFREAGDVFGLPGDGIHGEAAEAFASTLLYRFQGDAVISLVREGALACRMLQIAGAELDGRARHVALLSRADALGRLALFLRQRQRRPGDPIRLPMSQVDIARHIGISAEAVSRGLRTLVQQKVVAIHSRGLLGVTDPAALHAIVSAAGRSGNSRRSFSA